MRETLNAFLNYFAPLPAEQFNRFAEIFTPVNIKRLDHLYREGDNVRNLYYIHDGLMRGYYPKEGVEHTTSFYFGPCLMTDLPTVKDNTPTKMNMQALRETQCYEANYELAVQIAFENPDLLKAFYRMFEFMLNDLIDRQVSFIYYTPKERYLNLFKERPQLIEEIPQHYLASYLGVQPETLSRIRKKIVL